MPMRLDFWKKQEKDESSEKHAKPTSLSDFILGSQDGLVNVLGVILGVAIASQNIIIILAGGLAATFAESISMAAVAYTSTLARRDHYLKELKREKDEMKNLPDKERKEVRDIFKKWGFKGKKLAKVTNLIVSNPKAWLEFMMSHELSLSPIDRKQARKSALLVGIAAIIGSFVPLMPFFLVGKNVFLGVVWSLFVSAIMLFFVGWYKSKITIGKPYRSGLQMILIGMSSALAGFAIAYLVSLVG
jgi:VIT1/CCC1 family predicted Fe2+/Mn2+ transporter